EKTLTKSSQASATKAIGYKFAGESGQLVPEAVGWETACSDVWGVKLQLLIITVIVQKIGIDVK
ncbi:MAG: hypothetical protein ACKPGH_18455, partial [Dolichospermum sp.]